MTRILVIQTAAPMRVRHTVDKIAAGDIYPSPEITVLCSEDSTTLGAFSEVPGLQVTPMRKAERRGIVGSLRQKKFDVIRTFWTGEKKYRRRKFLALFLGARTIDIESGDGGVFRFTWKALIRFWLFRLRHPLPTDHWKFVRQPISDASLEGEKILIIQSADPAHILKALQRLQEQSLFRNPKFTLFCRNRPEVTKHFYGHPMIQEVRTHSETRGSWRHLRSLRRGRFDAIVVFFTGDPSYWKIKYFAFLLGARHRVVFNENNDCFYFSLRPMLALLLHRLGERSGAAITGGRTHQARRLLLLSVKTMVIPFRFAWLLLVWIRLRGSGFKESG